MKVLSMSAAALAATVLVAGCGGVELDDDGLPAPGVEVPAQRIAYEQYTGIENRQRLVIRTEAQWRAFWDEFTEGRTPQPARPDVDFSREVVVVAAMGDRPTGGYVIQIDDVYRTTAGLTAVVTETVPEADCAVTQARTAPVDVVRVPIVNEGVSFVERQEVLQCE